MNRLADGSSKIPEYLTCFGAPGKAFHTSFLGVGVRQGRAIPALPGVVYSAAGEWSILTAAKSITLDR